MSEFIATLRSQVDNVLEGMQAAGRSGRDDEVQRHRNRLQDLLDLALEHGVDTAGWVDPATRESL